MSTPEKTRKHNKLPALFIIVVAIVLLAVALWLNQRSPETNDAYVYADTIQVAPEVSGRIVAMPIQDNQKVEKGQLLFQIDPRPFKLQLKQAQAELDALNEQIMLTERSIDAQKSSAKAAQASVAAAKANARQATDTLNRVQPLLKKGYASPEEVDKARAAQQAAQAQLQAAIQQAHAAQSAVGGVEALEAKKVAAQAQIALAQLKLDYATVRAPFNGRVAGLKTRAGQLASPKTPIFTLIATDPWYVIANFRETELDKIHPGDGVTIYLMSNTHKKFKGTVDSIGYAVKSSEAGLQAPGGLPYVARTINWVHVSQRFPVRIKVDDPDENLFRIGASASVIVH